MFRCKPKRPRDPNQLAHQIVQESIGEAEKTPAPVRRPGRRAGGLKGGRTHADKLTTEERSEIARKAAAARWEPEPGAVRFRRSRSDPEDED